MIGTSSKSDSGNTERVAELANSAITHTESQIRKSTAKAASVRDESSGSGHDQTEDPSEMSTANFAVQGRWPCQLGQQPVLPDRGNSVDIAPDVHLHLRGGGRSRGAPGSRPKYESVRGGCCTMLYLEKPADGRAGIHCHGC